jgi:hypothetical protein
VRRGAHEAIPVLEAPNEIRVLFTDVRMPGSMNGYALAHYVHGRWPEVTIVFWAYEGERRQPADRRGIYAQTI